MKYKVIKVTDTPIHDRSLQQSLSKSNTSDKMQTLLHLKGLDKVKHGIERKEMESKVETPLKH
jgi:hypothetical protein